jgi:hypothetical protein
MFLVSCRVTLKFSIMKMNLHILNIESRSSFETCYYLFSFHLPVYVFSELSRNIKIFSHENECAYLEHLSLDRVLKRVVFT